MHVTFGEESAQKERRRLLTILFAALQLIIEQIRMFVQMFS
jgi:hypothetical protein